MYVPVEDMLQDSKQKVFFAKKTGESQLPSDNTAYYETEKKNHELTTLTATGGTSQDTYQCDLTITIARTDNVTLASGDAKLYLSGLGIQDSDIPSTGLDLSTLNSTKSKEITITDLEINANNGTSKLIGDFELNNTDEEQQDYLSGQKLGLTVTTSLTGCELKSE